MLAAGYRWLPLAAENRDTEGVGLSHFFHIRCFGVCYCGGKVVVLGVEAVCRRGVVDQACAHSADVDAGLGPTNCERRGFNQTAKL